MTATGDATPTICPGPASPQTAHRTDPHDPDTWCPECAPRPARRPGPSDPSHVRTADAWLRGDRSWTNVIYDVEPDPALREVRVAQVDAAMMEWAYWTMRAWREGLVFAASPRPKDRR